MCLNVFNVIQLYQYILSYYKKLFKSLSEKFFLEENKRNNETEHYSENDYQSKSVRILGKRHTLGIQVHSVGTEYHCWDRKNDGDSGKNFHDNIQVVVDDGCKSISHTAQDAGVDV